MTERPSREKREDERFCSECGEPVKRAAVVCVHCGVPLRPTVAGQQVRSGMGLEPNVAASLSYLLTWLTGIIFLLIERDDEYVRFHARQAIAFGVASVITWVVLFIFFSVIEFIPFVGDIVSTLVGGAFLIAWLVLWILLMVKAYQGERFKLPFLGEIAEGQSISAAR